MTKEYFTVFNTSVVTKYDHHIAHSLRIGIPASGWWDHNEFWFEDWNVTVASDRRFILTNSYTGK